MIEIIGVEKVLIIFDRGYPSIEFFYWLETRNIKFLMRLRGKDYKEEKQQMKQDDEIIELKYYYSRLQSIKKKYPKIYNEIKDKTGIKYRFTKIEVTEETTEYKINENKAIGIYKEQYISYPVIDYIQIFEHIHLDK